MGTIKVSDHAKNQQNDQNVIIIGAGEPLPVNPYHPHHHPGRWLIDSNQESLVY